MSASVRCNLTV